MFHRYSDFKYLDLKQWFSVLGQDKEKCNKPIEDNRDYIEDPTPFWAFNSSSKSCEQHSNIVGPNRFSTKDECDKNCINKK